MFEGEGEAKATKEVVEGEGQWWREEREGVEAN